MARPPQDAIETFMSITGASEAVALQKLEEHNGDLNEAINAHFSEGDRVNTNQGSIAAPHTDFMEVDDYLDEEPSRPTLPLLPRDLNAFSIVDSSFRRSYFDGEGATDLFGPSPHVSHTREVRQIPIEFKDDNNETGSSGLGPKIEDVTGSEPAFVPEVHGTVIIDDDDDDVDISANTTNHVSNASADPPFRRHSGSMVSSLADMTDSNNEIEEEMLRAAIEASRREAEQHASDQDLSGPPRSSALEDTDLARAVSLSLKTAEQERALREQGVFVGENQSSTPSIMESGAGATNGRQGVASTKAESSSQVKVVEINPSESEEVEELEEQPLVRHRTRHISSENAEPAESGQVSYSLPSNSPQHDMNQHSHYNGNSFQTDEWGGISSEEHDEAVMLEAAMFGGIPEGTAYRFAYPPHQAMDSSSYRNSAVYPQMAHPPSPRLTAERLLREQQDDEYLAALQADQEKELKAKQEAELRQLEEASAREVALQKQKQEEEENLRKQLEEEELERKLVAKEASLPQEPPSDEENAVTLLVRMPDGSRRGRRFLKSDRLQFLFDYIDIGRLVKPSSYRLVRPYPRQAFTDGEREFSLSELGLTSKQEALFLELI